MTKTAKTTATLEETGFFPAHMVQTKTDPVSGELNVFAYYEDMVEIFRKEHPNGCISNGIPQFLGETVIATASVSDGEGNALAVNVLGVAGPDEDAMGENPVAMAVRRARANALVTAGFGIPSLQRHQVIQEGDVVTEEVVEEVVEEKPKPARKPRKKKDITEPTPTDETASGKAVDEVEQVVAEAAPAETPETPEVPAEAEAPAEQTETVVEETPAPATEAISAKEVVAEQGGNILFRGEPLPDYVQSIGIPALNEALQEMVPSGNPALKVPYQTLVDVILGKTSAPGVDADKALNMADYLLGRVTKGEKTFLSHDGAPAAMLSVYLGVGEELQKAIDAYSAQKAASKQS